MLKVDVIIFGGGIAGLWTLACLRKLGYNAILLEANSLGYGQTIAAQGIIHGGLKYALNGQLSPAVAALKDLPSFWQQCLHGTGPLDLSQVKILAHQQNLWSIDKLIGGVTTLFASSALKSQVTTLEKAAWPAIISDSAIQSKLYCLNEMVLDVPSLIQELAKPYLAYCFKLPEPDTYQLEIAENNILSIRIKQLHITAQKYIFTAGKGNIGLITNLKNKPAVQLRPLKMVLVKDKNLLPLYGHCISLSATPRVTITTHTAQDQIPVWYLGGKIAEDGVHRSDAEQIVYAKQELATIFPRLDLSAAHYATFSIDRAEAKQANGLKPDSATVFNMHNYITAWPTKLALAPLLAQEIISCLQTENIQPQYQVDLAKINLTTADFTQPIWEQIL